MQVRVSLCLLLSCLGAACARAPASRSSERTREHAPIHAQPMREAPHRAPFHAWLEAPETPRPNESFELIVHVERRLAVDVPIQVELRVPRSAHLMQGKSRTNIGHVSEGTYDLRYRLTASSMPKDDLVVVVDARGTGFGYHAELPYRFGRPAPETAGLPIAGREVRVGARHLGPSIELKAK